MKLSDYVTSCEGALDDDDLSMVDTNMLSRQEMLEFPKLDPEVSKAKDVARLLKASCTIRKGDELRARGCEQLRRLWVNIMILQGSVKL